jgi:hypothetical protein
MRRRAGSCLGGLILLAAALCAATSSGAPLERESSPGTPRLTPCGAALCRPDGSRFHWRGVTAFALAGHIADGRDDDARHFARWASGHGFTVLRVLAMNHGWLDLPPEHGRRALPRLFAIARELGMYVQVVALAGTGQPRFDSDTFLREQVRAIGALCAAVDNCILEIANEPYHASQADLDNPARMQALAGVVPKTVPVAFGAAAKHTSDALAGGTFVVAHLPRGGERWERVARRADLARLSRRLGRFVVDNEPIGAADRRQRSRRDDDPAAFFAQAAVSGVLGLGATFHCDDCLHARVPSPAQQRSAEAFARGAHFVASAGPVRWLDSPGDGSPVERAAPEPGRRLFIATAETTAVVVALGPAARDDVRWRPGWKVRSEQAAGSEVHAWIADRVP